jgi:predicted transcriptional regulator
MSGSISKTVTMSVELEKELEEIAQRHRRSQAFIVRLAIEELIKKEKADTANTVSA